MLKYRHAWEIFFQNIAYADAIVSRRAMLCGVLAPNLNASEFDDAENLLTGIDLPEYGHCPTGRRRRPERH